MLDNITNNYKVILASGSPRRRELLSGLGIGFEIPCKKDIDESNPSDLSADEVALFISRKKAEAYKLDLADNQMVITADTVVICQDEVLGKPHNRKDAIDMLMMLSGRTHHVMTGVTITTSVKTVSFSAATDVRFNNLSTEEIEYYVDRFQPYDKAGAYGIQEWIGYIGVEYISGSYYNVMGLPIQRLYRELTKW